LVHFGITGLSTRPETITLAQHLIAAAGGTFLLVGFWTPVIGTLIALDEVWIAISHYAAQLQDSWIHLLGGVLSVCMAMLGPGAWSVDARLFGRKRFDISPTRGKRPSL
jgi:putative oxidoreductase